MVESLVSGTGKGDNATTTPATSDDGGGGVELDSAQKISTDAAVKTATSAEVDEGGVELVSVQRTRVRIPGISRKGQRAIGACILSIAVAVVVGVFLGFRMTRGGYDASLEFLGDICGTTLYPETCNSTLFGSDTASPKSYVSKSMVVSMTATNETLLNFTQCRDAWPSKAGMQYSTLQMCVDMNQDILYAEMTFLDALNSFSAQPDVAVVNELEQRASAALTYHFTCVKGLQAQGLWIGGRAVCGIATERTTELLSNALSLVGQFAAANESAITAPSRRRLLDVALERRWTDASKPSRRMLHATDEERFPKWLSRADRRVLQSTSNNITPNAVVALDGSGDYTSIQTAIDEAPSNSSQRHVIYIAAGIYRERVTVPRNKIRVTFVGEGAGATIITGNVSSGVHNVTTMFTATVTVLGDYFMAKNLTIRNTAGPNGHEAVALRVTSQQSAFTWLSIEGYQQTLYAHASQQFYSYCTIYGTVDCIFGSAAAEFQSCSLLARLPSPGQAITYTASAIASSLVQTHAGLVFHACLVNATPEVPAAQLVFLGRPGGAYALTAFLESKLGAVVNPAGWRLWNENSHNGSVTDHVEFVEFANFGPGSEFADRVPWSRQLSPVAASNYGVDAFLKGKLWLPALNISYSGSV